MPQEHIFIAVEARDSGIEESDDLGATVEIDVAADRSREQSAWKGAVTGCGGAQVLELKEMRARDEDVGRVPRKCWRMTGPATG
ncbi:MAG: hypothetical protein AB1486_21620 [Planctomycetota bacterium]